jgi:hypothetical protein
MAPSSKLVRNASKAEGENLDTRACCLLSRGLSRNSATICEAYLQTDLRALSFLSLGADPLVWSPPIECIGYARVSTDDQRLWTCNADALERFKGSAYETESFPFMVFPMADHWPQVCPARRQRPQEWPKPPQTSLSRRIGCLTDHLPTLDVGGFGDNQHVQSTKRHGMER